MTSQEGKTRVLLVEDSEIDAMLISDVLKKGEIDPEVQRVETSKEIHHALDTGTFDVVISDYLLPRFNGREALSIVRHRSEELPFILVSGKIGEEQAAEAIRDGANDYIMKSNLSRLPMAVERALEEAKIKIDRRKAREDLERSLNELKRRTDQLAESNRKMQIEMSERKKAQTEVMESREYLKSVIDSAPELVFSVDRNLRATTWNKSLQNLTGFTEKEVLTRSLEKLQPFQSSSDLLNLLRSNNKFLVSKVEFTLTTKDNVKKVIQAVSSTIRGSADEDLGIMFIGRDITPDIEAHGMLIDGLGYLIKDRTSKSSVDLFLHLTRTGKKGLFITRSNPGLVSSIIVPSSNIETLLLSQHDRTQMDDVLTRIDEFTNNEQQSVVLLDGGHYFVATSGFSKFLDLIFKLSDVLAARKSILLVRVDPNLLDVEKMAFLENELMILPSQKIEDVVIEDDSYSMLKFVQEQNENNSLVSLKKISSKFQISHVTVAKRIESLEKDGLIYIKKIGKQRAPFLTEKGKALLSKKRAL